MLPCKQHCLRTLTMSVEDGGLQLDRSSPEGIVNVALGGCRAMSRDILVFFIGL